jgi:hypothetical protein
MISPSEDDSKHEGFLKSVWNKLTDHGSEGDSKKESSKKDEKDPKKSAGTGA